MSKLAASIFCVLAALAWIRSTRREVQASPSVRRIRDLDEAIAILRESTLASRAEPNQRLVRAFGIDSSFTTTIPEVHKVFLAASLSLLRTDDDQFNRLAAGAKWILDRRTSQVRQQIPLVETIQVFVFRVCLSKFFPGIPDPSEADAILITRNINTRWIESKEPDTAISPAQLRSRKDLDSAVRKIFQLNPDPAVAIPPMSNPLNILLPAYEALWQVVLSGFLQLAFRSNHPDARVWRQQLEVFLEDPTRAAFDDQANGTPVRHIVAETLRLYPPTKRIKRVHNGELVDIDVEYLQRDVEVWGHNA